MNWMSTSSSRRSRRRAQKLLRIGVSRCSSSSLRVRQFHEQVRIVVADVEVVVHAGGLGARGLDQAVENLEKLLPLFRLGVKIGDQGASRLHVASQTKALPGATRARLPLCGGGDDSDARLLRQFRPLGLRSRSSRRHEARGKRQGPHRCARAQRGYAVNGVRRHMADRRVRPHASRAQPTSGSDRRERCLFHARW